MKSLEVKKHMTNKQLSAFLEALAVIAEQNPKNAAKNIRQIKTELQNKKSVDGATSTEKKNKAFK